MKTVKKENSRSAWMIRLGMLLRNPKVALPVLALLAAGLIIGGLLTLFCGLG